MFSELMEMQYHLQKSMDFPGTGDEFRIHQYSEQGVKEMLLAAMIECSEALGEISWKCWKPSGYKETNKELLTTELTDIIQFVANAAIYAGITGPELDKALRAKWKVNFERIAKGETTRE